LQLVGQLLTMIHNAQTHEHKKKNIFYSSSQCIYWQWNPSSVPLCMYHRLFVQPQGSYSLTLTS